MQKLFGWADKSFKYLMAAVLLAVPLYPKFPFIRIPGTYVSVRLEDFLMALVGLYLAWKIFPKIREYLQKDIERAIFVYLAVGLISLVAGIFLTKTVLPQIGILHWVRRVEYFLPFFAGAFLISPKDKTVLPFFVKLLALVVMICALYGFGQRYFHWPIIITQNQEYAKGIALRWVPGSHVNATFAGHYDLASFLVMVMPIFVCLMVLVKEKWAKIGLSVIFLAGVWLLANTVSRLSVVSYLLGTSLALLLLKRYKAIFFVALGSLIIFVSTGALISRYSEIWDVARFRLNKIQRMFLGRADTSVWAADPTLQRKVVVPSPTPESVSVIEDRSSSIRFNVEWPRAIRALSKNPLLGTGYSSITLATDNDYLRLLGETGILGFAAFGLIFVFIGKALFHFYPFKMRSVYETAFIAGLIGALPGLFLNAAFIDIFEASKFAILFWLLVGILVRLARLTKYEY